MRRFKEKTSETSLLGLFTREQVNELIRTTDDRWMIGSIQVHGNSARSLIFNGFVEPIESAVPGVHTGRYRLVDARQEAL